MKQQLQSGWQELPAARSAANEDGQGGLPMPASQMPVEAVLEWAQVDPACGLDSTEAARRLQRDGPNQLPFTPPVPAWLRFLRQFADPLTLLLLGAMAISLLAWEIETGDQLPWETLTILFIVVFNAALGFMQERRAEEAVSRLKALSAPTARVLREREPCQIPASEVVPGDILLIEEGDTLPADARVIESIALRIAEAVLTGESAPASKNPQAIPGEAGIGDQENMVFSGTAVMAGRGRAVVTATGARTEIGRIAHTLQLAQDEPTPLQKELARVGRLLGRAVIAIALFMGVILLWLSQPGYSLSQLLAVLMFSVSLAVAAVPEGLTAINTIILSLGMVRMARRNVIVRRLSSVETLGSTTVICSDKTGTLTRNEMTVRSVVVPGGRVDFCGTGYAPEGALQWQGAPLADGALKAAVQRLLYAAELVNNARLVKVDGRWSIQGDPTEGALIVAARKAGIDGAYMNERFIRIGEVPFTAERKMMSTAHRDLENARMIGISAKGAPDVLLGCCTHEQADSEIRPLTPERREAWLAVIEGLAGEALRTMGVACRLLAQDRLESGLRESHEAEMIFLGVIGMIDPPRPEAVAAVRTAIQAGIRPVMITGDHQATAAAIAAELGIIRPGERAVTGIELEGMDDAALRRTVRTVSVYARVSPEHKLRIVSALQAEGEIAAMTGDGVNDAPALRKADIGVAMGMTGTDVSRGAADMVLTDDNFASIVAAIEEGRGIFANIRKFLRFLLSSNIGEILFIFFGVVLAGMIGLKAESGGGLAMPLLAVQILWVNLLTDSSPALALGVDPLEPGIMQKPPRDPFSHVISGSMWPDMVFVGMIMAGGALAVTDWVLPGGLIPGGTGSVSRAQTMAFNTLVFFQLFNAFNVRSESRSAFCGLFANRWLVLAVGVTALLQVAVIHMPFLQRAFGTEALTASQWLVSIGVGSTVLWLVELKKLLLGQRPADLCRTA